MRTRTKIQNIESYSIRELRARRAQQDATIIFCALFTFGIIIWSVVR